MRSSLRRVVGPGRLAAAALVLCLAVPPLQHTHAGHDAPVTPVAGQPCSHAGAAGHLHPAARETAPPCPACAAGPTWNAALAAHAHAAPVVATRIAVPSVVPGHAGEAVAPSSSRAPPHLPFA